MNTEKSGEAVLFEGVLGELEDLEVIDEAVLCITGTKGTLMVDLSNEEIKNRRTRAHAHSSISSHS